MGRRAQIAPVAPTCLQALAGMLLEVCKNPTQPGFNHFLFESVAALVRYTAAAGGGAGGVERLEAQLFPAFKLVLQQDVQARLPAASLPAQCPYTCLLDGMLIAPGLGRLLRLSGQDARSEVLVLLLSCRVLRLPLHSPLLPRPLCLQAPAELALMHSI